MKDREVMLKHVDCSLKLHDTRISFTEWGFVSWLLDKSYPFWVCYSSRFLADHDIVPLSLPKGLECLDSTGNRNFYFWYSNQLILPLLKTHVSPQCRPRLTLFPPWCYSPCITVVVKWQEDPNKVLKILEVAVGCVQRRAMPLTLAVHHIQVSMNAVLWMNELR